MNNLAATGTYQMMMVGIYTFKQVTMTISGGMELTNKAQLSKKLQ
jgi:hypothetical protein